MFTGPVYSGLKNGFELFEYFSFIFTIELICAAPEDMCSKVLNG